jgi:hypothetical protein
MQTVCHLCDVSDFIVFALRLSLGRLDSSSGQSHTIPIVMQTTKQPNHTLYTYDLSFPTSFPLAVAQHAIIHGAVPPLWLVSLPLPLLRFISLRALKPPLPTPELHCRAPELQVRQSRVHAAATIIVRQPRHARKTTLPPLSTVSYHGLLSPYTPDMLATEPNALHQNSPLCLSWRATTFSRDNPDTQPSVRERPARPRNAAVCCEDFRLRSRDL